MQACSDLTSAGQQILGHILSFATGGRCPRTVFQAQGGCSSVIVASISQTDAQCLDDSRSADDIVIVRRGLDLAMLMLMLIFDVTDKMQEHVRDRHLLLPAVRLGNGRSSLADLREGPALQVS